MLRNPTKHILIDILTLLVFTLLPSVGRRHYWLYTKISIWFCLFHLSINVQHDDYMCECIQRVCGCGCVHG
jgi:hypothetical protein